MEIGEIETLVSDLETRVDRLRALYDQYFMGIEKLEPAVPRKDVERRVQVLRKEQIRNTALRFRFQMVLQRYNTYQTYWQRICRQIEDGTYKRHVDRARARFEPAMAGRTEPAPPPAPDTEPRLAPAPAFDDLDVEFDLESTPAMPTPPRLALDEDDELFAGLENLELRDPGLPAPRAVPVAAAPAPAATSPRAGGLWRKAVPGGATPDGTGGSRPSPGSADGKAAAPTPRPPLTAAPQAPRPTLTGSPPARPPILTGAPPPKPVLTGTPPPKPPAIAGTPPPKPVLTGSPPPRPPALTGAPPPKPPALTGAPPPRPPALTSAPPPRPPALTGAPPRPALTAAPPPRAALTAATPPANRAPAATPAGAMSDDRVRQLYTQFVDTKRRQNESTAGVTYEGLKKSLAESSQRLREKHGGKAVDFEVAVKDGKTILRPVLK